LNVFKRFFGDCRGSLQVNVLAIVLIIVTFIVWIATFSPIFMVIDRLLELPIVYDTARIMSIVRLCNIVAGISLLCEVISYIIWAVASEFKREDQTFAYGGMF
jgi:hypothetical protein